MWPAALTRLLKRRLIYIIITIILLVYTVTKAFQRPPHHQFFESDDFSVERTQPLIWRTLEEHLLPDEPQYRTNSPNTACQSTKQGKYLITDDRGFVCQVENLLPSGCCNVQNSATKYYTCDTCDNTTHCCGIYEYCVSCCLHPDKRAILELALEVIQGRQAILYAQVKDQFELCLFKCRTNSHSVEHENRYRDETHRFCYGPTKAHESQIEVSAVGS